MPGLVEHGPTDKRRCCQRISPVLLQELEQLRADKERLQKENRNLKAAETDGPREVV